MKREKNKELTKNLIISSAMELFRQQEYQNTSIDQIVKKAGVSKPTFFAYFKSKEQILYEFDLKQLKTFEDQMRKQLNDEDGDLFDNLISSMVQMATNLHTTHIFTQNLMHLVTISEHYKELLFKTTIIFESVAGSVLQYGQEHNLVVTHIPPNEIAKNLFSIYFGTLVSWVISNGSESLEERMEAVVSQYLEGIKLRE